MSEYQYYEFRAVDRPLTPAELEEVRSLSTRAEISPTRFQNVYNYGDFKGDPEELVERFYDAHLYDSNFQFRRFLIRVPKEALEETDVAPYLTEESLTGWSTETAILLDFRVEDADPDLSEDSESWMPDLLPIRDALMAGDLRPLYLGWLRGVQREEMEEEEEEPPVPPGLGEFNEALRNLSDFLELDSALIEVAAMGSPPLPREEPLVEADVRAWLSQLPEEQVTESLLQVILGDARGVKGALQKAYKEAFRDASVEGGTISLPPARPVGLLLDAAEKLNEIHHQALEEERWREKEADRREKLARRMDHLDRVRSRGEKSWQQVDEWVSMTRSKEYDLALARVLDLKEIHSIDGDLAGFEGRVFHLFTRHKKKPAFVERLRKAGLV